MPNDKYASQRKWKANHKTSFLLDLYENNTVMIDWIKSQKSFAGYVKELIEKDMIAHGVDPHPDAE